MVEWKRLPRSIRFENDRVACDVWKHYGREWAETGPPRVCWKYTVYDRVSKVYLDNGNARTQDEACELSLKAAKV